MIVFGPLGRTDRKSPFPSADVVVGLGTLSVQAQRRTAALA